MSHVGFVAWRATLYAEENGNELPQHLSDLFPDHFQRGSEDRSLIYEISGNRDAPANVQRFPTLLRYAIVVGDTEAIVHQVPGTNEFKKMVWQRLRRESQLWIVDGHPESGSFAELSEAVAEISQSESQQEW